MREHAWSRNSLHDHASAPRGAPLLDAAGRQRGVAARLRRRAPRRWAAALAALWITASSCSSFLHPAFGAGAAADAWPTTFATVQARVSAGDYGGADSALAQFARQYPGTPAALETSYWRGLIALDPANNSRSLMTAMAELDGYLADERPRQHATEAGVLRRVGGELDGLNKAAESALAQAKDAKATAATATASLAAADAAAKDAAAKADAAAASPGAAEEIKRLKDELAKANAELDRIKKRLSQPPPKP